MLERLFPQQADDRLFVEDVFSTWLYASNNSSQTITNGIDLAGKGGLVWEKVRDGIGGHVFTDTVRGPGRYLLSNTTGSEVVSTVFGAQSFLNTGFGSSAYGPGNNIASWTFREAPKFFDVVTYTGNGAGDRNIPHNLGIQPGAIIVKSVSQSGDWVFNHRLLGPAPYVGYGTSFLNSAEASTYLLGEGNLGYNGYALCASSSSTTFNIGAGGAGVSNVNASGVTYVAYLFAHDPSADGIIQCGSFTTNGSGYANVNLGYEPQWIMYKSSDSTGSWGMGDVMRGMPASTTTTGTGNSAQRLFANNSNAEGAETNYVCNVNSTGFTFHSGGYPSSTFIYIAIRRGPMRTPTLGTSVFNAQANLTTDANKITTGFVTDWFWQRSAYNSSGNRFQCSQRLTQTALSFNSTAAEGGPYGAGYLMFDYNDGFLSNLAGNISPGLMYGFRRAPGFMDVVCYTGNYNGSNAPLITHNLGVKPELIIQKKRFGTSAFDWFVVSDVVPGSGIVRYGILNTGAAFQSINSGLLAPTQTGFPAFQSFDSCVAYLFASVPGVSKVGTYTGNGSSQTINCAFTTGARFVLIKRTDSTGDWYVWDSARGIVAGNDPYLALNTTAAEVASNDSVDADGTGFIVNQVAASNINVNGATYIFLSIA